MWWEADELVEHFRKSIDKCLSHSTKVYYYNTTYKNQLVLGTPFGLSKTPDGIFHFGL